MGPRPFHLVSPATTIDLAEACGLQMPMNWAMIRASMQAGASFALRDGQGVAVACGAIVMLKGRCWACFVVHPERGPRAMLAIMRAIALTFRQSPYPSISVEVATPAGGRMAKALGFTHTSERIWTWTNSQAFLAEDQTTARP